jgi:hypothetical protein
MPNRFVDDFRAHLEATGLPLPGELQECLMFGDLEWPPNSIGGEDVLARIVREPAFTVSGHTRWLAFARICNEIRYYAAPLPTGATAWRASDPERRAAIDAEPDEYELGIVPSVADAVALALEYLGGPTLASISVPRTRLGGRPKPERAGC